MGVIFGIAFLMSMLTGQLVKDGVKEEEDLRTETKRIYSFLQAEIGPPKDRIIGVYQAGPLSSQEQRLLKALEKEDLAKFQWVLAEDTKLNYTPAGTELAMVPLDSIGAGASAVLVLGAGEGAAAAEPAGAAAPAADEDNGAASNAWGPKSLSWAPLLEQARQQVVASTATGVKPVRTEEDVSFVPLARKLQPDEKAKIEQEKKQARFRTTWIIIVSLLVTVIGISNAMLMSVTERFREIGTMKCLGALSAFIRQLFLIESCLMGVTGGLIGAVFGVFFSLVMYGFTYGFGMVLGSLNWGLLFGYVFFSLVVGVVLSMIAAIYPARFASSMVPADALRSNI